MSRWLGAVSALVVLFSLWACAPDAGSAGSAGQGKASDASTVTAVEDRIKAEPALAGADVKVTEQNGTVMLDGTVSSVEAKDKAEAAVLEVQKEKGLQTGVLNNLMVDEGSAAPGGKDGGSSR